MISPPRPGDAYPGRLPPVRQQWARLSVAARVPMITLPLLVVVLVLVFSPAAGVTLAVLFAGAGAATVMYAKNRTDRHNAAVDRGDIALAPDPHFERVQTRDIPADLVSRLDRLGCTPGRVVRFDVGWIVRQRNPRDVALVIGDDGGWARFDPRLVNDLWAATEYRAGRGHETDA